MHTQRDRVNAPRHFARNARAKTLGPTWVDGWSAEDLTVIETAVASRCPTESNQGIRGQKWFSSITAFHPGKNMLSRGRYFTWNLFFSLPLVVTSLMKALFPGAIRCCVLTVVDTASIHTRLVWRAFYEPFSADPVSPYQPINGLTSRN